ncbi:hypothetical protein [Mesorhizobium sp.]|uniref:hypothetical protein n=1 Tax=Mesorhizobium sp. TaxID=1871066 RepID=UPI0025FC1B9F|nr:hypothetical protein [Mesorhizobium sp.]
MDAQVRKLFERYEQLFRKSLAGDADMDEVASVYASAFIAASPAGVMVGNNDDQFKQAMEQGYAHYRAIGTKEMRIRDVRISPIDEHHCVAHVAWTLASPAADGRKAASHSDRVSLRCAISCLCVTESTIGGFSDELHSRNLGIPRHFFPVLYAV